LAIPVKGGPRIT